MKKEIIALLAILGIMGASFFYAGEKLAVANENRDLLTLITVLDGENIDINGWSLLAREKLNLKQLEDVKKRVQQMKKSYPDWKWKETSNEKTWQATASNISNQGITESIQILSTLTEENPQTYMIYEVQGKNFTSKTEQFIKEDITGTLSDIFRGDTTIFTCIKGEFNDMMNTTLPMNVNRLLNLFQAKAVESMSESDFISASAYSPLLAEGLTTNKEDMNLQIGIRKEGLGAKTTLVVGTPIITIEY